MKPRPVRSLSLSMLGLALIPILASGCAGIPKVLPPEARSQVTQTNVVRIQPERVAQGAAMNIGTDFVITPDHRVFEVLTGVSIFLPAKHKKAAAANMMAYHSARIGDEEGDKAAALWMADQGAAYR